MRLLVIGGAGYIGSVTSELLLARGHQVTILDNFSTGHRAAAVPGAEVIAGDLGDPTVLGPLFRRGCDAVVHFAARSIVPESVEMPGVYFANNVAGAVTLLNTMVEHAVSRIVFSSSAAVYGIPDQVPVSEEAPIRPNNPYGATKAMVEEMLRWYANRGQLSYAALRYFNAAGASTAYGEDHHPETHLIGVAVGAALKNQEIKLYGTDYPTRDGTAIRDYIHVLDLADAHARAIERLDRESFVCNLGTETGYSVREVLDTVRQVTGAAFPTTEAPRRAGDPPATIASAQRGRKLLGWTPQRGLQEMVESAWIWRNRYPDGYPD